MKKPTHRKWKFTGEVAMSLLHQQEYLLNRQDDLLSRYPERCNQLVTASNEAEREVVILKAKVAKLEGELKRAKENRFMDIILWGMQDMWSRKRGKGKNGRNAG